MRFSFLGLYTDAERIADNTLTLLGGETSANEQSELNLKTNMLMLFAKLKKNPNWNQFCPKGQERHH